MGRLKGAEEWGLADLPVLKDSANEFEAPANLANQNNWIALGNSGTRQSKDNALLHAWLKLEIYTCTLENYEIISIVLTTCIL